MAMQNSYYYNEAVNRSNDIALFKEESNDYISADYLCDDIINKYNLNGRQTNKKNLEFNPIPYSYLNGSPRLNIAHTIVIVEDNIDLRDFIKNKLFANYNCYVAGNGQEGYELIAQIIPDVVISDVKIAKMDGYELCQKMKGNIETCHIPIILLIANKSIDQIVEGFENGADAYVQKPFEMSIIKAQISGLIRNRKLVSGRQMNQKTLIDFPIKSLTRDDKFMLDLRRLLEENLSEPNFNVKKLSDDLNLSATHLYRKLIALTGLSPVEFIRSFKLQKASAMINNTCLSIKEIGYAVGFNNLSYFVKCFRMQYRFTPSAYRQKVLLGERSNYYQSAV